MSSIIFLIYAILLAGSANGMTGSDNLWQGYQEKQLFRLKWCKKPGFCEICRYWNKDPQRTARLWYQKDGIASIQASIVSESFTKSDLFTCLELL